MSHVGPSYCHVGPLGAILSLTRPSRIQPRRRELVKSALTAPNGRPNMPGSSSSCIVFASMPPWTQMPGPRKSDWSDVRMDVRTDVRTERAYRRPYRTSAQTSVQTFARTSCADVRADVCTDVITHVLTDVRMDVRTDFLYTGP